MSQKLHICVLYLEGQQSSSDAKKAMLGFTNCLFLFKPLRSVNVDSVFFNFESCRLDCLSKMAQQKFVSSSKLSLPIMTLDVQIR